MINLDVVRKTPVTEDPFPYLVAENTIDKTGISNIGADFPDIRSPGIFPLSALEARGTFEALIREIQGPELRRVLEEKFHLDLSSKPLMVTVRGQCQKKDGRIHTDSKDKILTCLLYLNESWGESGGRLRLLRDGKHLDNMIAEVPPDGGTLVAFKRTDHSWHGHYPFEGRRRYIMFNWLTSDTTLEKNLLRHRLSAWAKKRRAVAQNQYALPY